jgi:protein-disulfide isomerase
MALTRRQVLATTAAAALGWDTIEGLADAAGAPAETVVEEAREEYWRPVVEADTEAGSDRGVGGTPTVFVNDYEVPFDESWTEFYENIAGAIDDRRDG